MSSSARQRLALLAMALLIPLLALSMATVRGPMYFGVNIDPEYAYLLNSLRLAEGHSPRHTDHPGTPVQVLGAAVIRVVHAARPGAPMRDDVLLHPELYIRSIQTAIVVLVALLSYLGGSLALRATGSLSAAALVQAAPLYLACNVSLMDRIDPEPFLAGFGMVLAGCVLRAALDDRPSRESRAALPMGAIMGIATASRMLFAPLGLIPLVALRGRGPRIRYILWSAAFLALSLLPITSQLPRVARWIHGLATHTGRYGMGESGVVNTAAFGSALRQLAISEPVYIVLTLAGLGAPILCFFAGRLAPDPRRPRIAATLFATGLAQLALLLLVAKHPSEHYLASGAVVGGLSMILLFELLRRTPAAPWPRGAQWAAGVIALALLTLRTPAVLSYRDYFSRTSLQHAPVAAFMLEPGNANILQGARISTLPSALHFGNFWAGSRYTADLERLYPGVMFWDWMGITAFGRPATREEVARVFPGRELRAVVSGWFDPQSTRPKGLDILTLKAFGLERLIQASTPLPAPPGTQPFAGFFDSTGLGPAEGPYPPSKTKVRWGLAPQTTLEFQSPGGPTAVLITARPNTRPAQSMQISLNGDVIANHEFLTRQFEPFTLRFTPPAGRNQLTFRYAQTEEVGRRSLSVLYSRIQIIPDPFPQRPQAPPVEPPAPGH